MSGHIAFPLSDGQILTIRIALESGGIDLEGVRDGSILWGFDAFVGDKGAKNKFCEDILAWPYRNCGKLRNVRLEVSTSDQHKSTSSNWLGESFGLACAIAFARSQSEINLNQWPTVIATGVMRRDGNRLLVDPVEQGESFTKKINGVLACPLAPEFFIYPQEQTLSSEDRELLQEIESNDTTVLAVRSLMPVRENGICPQPLESDRTSSVPERANVDPARRESPDSDRRRTRAQRPNQDTYAAASVRHKETAGYPRSDDLHARERHSTEPAPAVNYTSGAGLHNAHDPNRGSVQKKTSTNWSHGLVRLFAPLLFIVAVYSMWPLMTTILERFNNTNRVNENTISQSQVDNAVSIEELADSDSYYALARSDSGWYGTSLKQTTIDAATRIALESCRSNKKNQEDTSTCRVITVNGVDVENFEPPKLSEKLGRMMITGTLAAAAFDQDYSRQPGNKVFVYSQGGRFRWSFDYKKSVESLSKKSLSECRDNHNLEVKFPCRIVNVNGMWIRADADRPIDKDRDGIPDQLEVDDGSNPDDPTSFKDSDGDGVPDRIEMIDGTDLQVRESFKDSDGDGDPDRSELVDGTDPDDHASFKDTDGDGVSDRAEVADGTDPEDISSVNDTDGDGVPDRLELIDGTSSIDPNRYKDSDRDSVSDREELIDGTDPNNRDSFKDSDGDGVPDRFEPFDVSGEFIEKYKKGIGHKAIAAYTSMSSGDRGKSSAVFGHTSANAAARLALDRCKLKNEIRSTHHCRLVNVDGIWVKDYLALRLDEDLTPIMLTRKSAVTAFEQYTEKSNNRVFVYSMGGHYSMGADSEKSIVELSAELLDECRKIEPFWESKYPCRVVNINGQWRSAPAPVPASVEPKVVEDKKTPQQIIKKEPQQTVEKTPAPVPKVNQVEPKKVEVKKIPKKPQSTPPPRTKKISPERVKLLEKKIKWITSTISNSKVLDTYLDHKKHKAFAFSDIRHWQYVVDWVDPDYAARFALERCRQTNDNEDKHPCYVANVDGEWVKDFNPPVFPQDPGKDWLMTNSALEAFDNKYSKITGSKVFVGSVGGYWSYTSGAGRSVDQLIGDALKSCQEGNDLEPRFPCRVININGEWRSNP